MNVFIGIVLLLVIICVAFIITREAVESDDCIEDKEDNRKLKFLLRNSLNYSNARRYIENICYNNDITDYEIKEFIDDEKALWTEVNGEQYIIFLDHDSLELKISHGGSIVKVFTKDTAWNNAIQYLHEKADLQ